jgi:hypothetical protein
MSNSASSTGSPRFPTFGRLFRWFFSRRTLGRILVGLAALVTLVALVCTEESWRGKRAWERYKHELEAQGKSWIGTIMCRPRCRTSRTLP